MSDKEMARYEDFLKSADILGQVIKDMDILGYVGEMSPPFYNSPLFTDI